MDNERLEKIPLLRAFSFFLRRNGIFIRHLRHAQKQLRLIVKVDLLGLYLMYQVRHDRQQSMGQLSFPEGYLRDCRHDHLSNIEQIISGQQNPEALYSSQMSCVFEHKYQHEFRFSLFSDNP